MDDDRAIVERVLRGDKAAFGCLIDRHRSHHAHRFRASCHPEAAQRRARVILSEAFGAREGSRSSTDRNHTTDLHHERRCFCARARFRQDSGSRVNYQLSHRWMISYRRARAESAHIPGEHRIRSRQNGDQKAGPFAPQMDES